VVPAWENGVAGENRLSTRTGVREVVKPRWMLLGRKTANFPIILFSLLFRTTAGNIGSK